MTQGHEPSSPTLIRGLGLSHATALNVANMIGIGPFITIPQFLAATQGPHAIIAWIVALVIVACDGLVWSELGAALPGSGGTYHYFREIFAEHGLGRLLRFLFIWQFLVTAALETAAGYVGAAGFLTFVEPRLSHRWAETPFTGENVLAFSAALVVMLALCRHISSLGSISLFLCAGTILTVATVTCSGIGRFEVSTLGFDRVNIQWNGALILGLIGSTRIAIFDYLGYYNVCHLGDEVRDPARTIPRAVLLSVVIVAAIYLTMNVSIIGVIPWETAMESKNVVADFMTAVYGSSIASLFTILVIWTAVAGLFAMTLGYSRIPYAAAKNGDFFRIFGYVHPRHRYPLAAILFFGSLVALACFIQLSVLVEAAVTIRIPMQFIGQIVALHLYRRAHPTDGLPFRMWLYPLPSLVALIGWIFLLVTAQHLAMVGLVLLTGCVAFAAWQLANSMTSPAPHTE